MKISDLLRLSFDNLKRRKGRTILTVLGVVIGTCSIVMMVSIGVALSKSYDDMLSDMGDLTLIEVYNWGQSGENDPLTDDVIDGFEEMEGVKLATPLYSMTGEFNLGFASGNNDKYIMSHTSIRGIKKEAIEDYGYEVKEGRFPTRTDKEFSILVGEQFAYNFENSKKRYPNNVVDPVEDENGILRDDIKLQGWTYDVNGNGREVNLEKEVNVVGILKEDYSKGYETGYGVIMDLDDLISFEEEYYKANGIKNPNRGKKREYDEALVKVNEMEDVEAVETRIKDMGYDTYSTTSMREQMMQETRIIQLILGGLGSIAMLVSAISIANTMTMAIYERTKEIGVMKVLGCELRDIKNMFLAEAAGIGFIGGTVGVIISYLLSFLINAFASGMLGAGDEKISIIPVWLAAFGMLFAALVGVISGYVPAVKAVKITALSAIRHE